MESTTVGGRDSNIAQQAEHPVVWSKEAEDDVTAQEKSPEHMTLSPLKLQILTLVLVSYKSNSKSFHSSVDY